MFRLIWLALGLGCSGSEDPSTLAVDGGMYTLALQPITAAGQEDLLDRASDVGLIVHQGDGTKLELPLTDKENNIWGGTPHVPALSDAVLTVVGISDSEVLYYGHTKPITISTGYQDVQLFVAEADAPSVLDPLPNPSSFAPLVATGDGRFFLFGGTSGGLHGSTASDTILGLDLVNIDNDIRMRPLSVSMPSTADGLAGRVGHTATALPADGDEAGSILIAGGSSQFLGSDGTFVGQSDATKGAFLFDPNEEAITPLVGLSHPRFDHQALLNPAGRVVVIGGWGLSSGGTPSTIEFVETFDPSTETWETASETLTAGTVFQAAARLGEQGILVCGGLASDMTYTDQCDLIVTNGLFEEGPDLPIPLAHASMASLPDGRVLLTGGLDTSEADFQLEETPALDATRKAWVTDGSQWEQVGSMTNERAMHTSVTLADGRVLIVGGVTGIDPDDPRTDANYSGILYDHTLAIACGEIFDPETEHFEEVDSCTESTAVATLPERTLLAHAATDPVHGTVVAGGIGVAEGGAVDGLVIYRLGMSL